jgi:hypothetical protein
MTASVFAATTTAMPNHSCARAGRRAGLAAGGAPPIPVWLAWWRGDPPEQLADLVALTRTTYRSAQPRHVAGAPGATVG